MAARTRYKRGYAVAILLGFEEDTITLWNVFSKVVKPSRVFHIKENRTNSKALYNLQEQVVDALRPAFEEGIKSVILVSPPRTTYSKDFRDHVEKHHSWLSYGLNKVAFSELVGSANTTAEVTRLSRNPSFRKIVNETANEETTNLLELLEKRLNTASNKDPVLYSPQEVEKLIFQSRGKIDDAEYLLLTDKYLAEYRIKSKLNRLLQIATNHNVKTRIIQTESIAGKRLAQLGGFVCLRKKT